MRLLSILLCATTAVIGIEGLAVTSNQHPHVDEHTVADSKELQISKIAGPAETEIEKIVKQDNNGTLREGCPPFSELPIADEELKNFYGIRYYDDIGGQISSLACSGDSYDLPPGKYDSDDTIDTWHPIGTLFVHHGCTLYIFEKIHFEGEMRTFRGPLSDFCADDLHPDFGVECISFIPSMILECGMQFPDCKPTDEWTSVAVLDNSDSSLPSRFTYEYQIGTEWSSEISQGFNIDYSVTATIKASFFGLFEAEGSSSFSTGYNWQSTSSEAKSEVKTFTIETEIPPGTVFKIYQAKGLCGNSEVQTELFKTEDTRTGEWKIFYH